MAGLLPWAGDPESVRDTVAEAFDVVVSVERQFDGSRRVTRIDDVDGYDAQKKAFVLRNVWAWAEVPDVGGPVRHEFRRNPQSETTPRLSLKFRAFGLGTAAEAPAGMEVQEALAAVSRMEADFATVLSLAQGDSETEVVLAAGERLADLTRQMAMAAGAVR